MGQFANVVAVLTKDFEQLKLRMMTLTSIILMGNATQCTELKPCYVWTGTVVMNTLDFGKFADKLADEISHEPVGPVEPRWIGFGGPDQDAVPLRDCRIRIA
jgi:hypothetical protein